MNNIDTRKLEVIRDFIKKSNEPSDREKYRQMINDLKASGKYKAPKLASNVVEDFNSKFNSPIKLKGKRSKMVYKSSNPLKKLLSTKNKTIVTVRGY